MQRLYDSRFGDNDVRNIRDYIHMGPLGRALFQSEQRVVLLIDEIDKADIEFPNDLLHELDRMRFTVAETGDEIVANQLGRSLSSPATRRRNFPTPSCAAACSTSSTSRIGS